LFYEFKITVLVKQSTHHLEMQEHIGSWLHRAQLADPVLKASHYDTNFKHFIFSNLYPIEKDGVYQKGRAYIIRVRSARADTLNRMNSCVKKCREDEYFQLVACEQGSVTLSHITEMISITPVIVTINHKPWVHENSIEQLIKRLHSNAEKKFKDLYPDDQQQSFQEFIQGLVIENKKPIAISYKNRKLLGNKLRLFINEDEYSQKMANVVLGSGLGEKGSSIGAGFCLAKCIK